MQQLFQRKDLLMYTVLNCLFALKFFMPSETFISTFPQFLLVKSHQLQLTINLREKMLLKFSTTKDHPLIGTSFSHLTTANISYQFQSNRANKTDYYNLNLLTKMFLDSGNDFLFEDILLNTDASISRV